MSVSKGNIAIIPARSGSKGLLNKNIKLCSGKPLIAWTIEAAKKSKYIDKILVTTDSEEIAEIAKDYGAWAPFIRPASLSSDSASTADVIKHAINFLEAKDYNFEFLVYLQPTSPLRTARHVDHSVEYYHERKNNNSDTLVSVYQVDKKYNWLMKQDSNGYVNFRREVDSVNPQRQKLESLYMPNGAIYIANVEGFDGFYLGNVIPYIMSQETSIDIDTQEDFNKACDELPH